jgi:hypothetical protein
MTYARAEAALASFEDVLSLPKRTRKPNLLLVGATNNGKTKIRGTIPPSPPAYAGGRDRGRHRKHSGLEDPVTPRPR